MGVRHPPQHPNWDSEFLDTCGGSLEVRDCDGLPFWRSLPHTCPSSSRILPKGLQRTLSALWGALVGVCISSFLFGL